jgi:perosamine synthetase
VAGAQTIKHIPITKPLFGAEEMAAVQKPLETGWVVQGPYVKEFETKFAAFTGAPYAAAASSCTTALHLAVAALGLQPGDEVIVPAFTWVATANVVEYMGAVPVFCDIDLDTFNIDPRQIEALITPRTVGMIPVHLFGLCADMPPILSIAQKHRLWVVEDAACGFGARWQGQHSGYWGDAGCFSFHPRKSITTGEGGMITTRRADLDAKMRSLRDHGASRSDLARHEQRASFLLAEYNALGYNYRMTDMQGALGSVQMDRAAWILQERARRAACYTQRLGEIDWLKLPIVPAGHEHGWQSYVCLFQPQAADRADVLALYERRNAVMDTLEQRGIATRQGTHAAALQGYYVEKYGLRPEQFPQAFAAEKLTITLPLYAQMTDDEQDYVVDALREIVP